MNKLQKVLDQLHSPIHNYIVPGLSSYLVGDQSNGVKRAFMCERNQCEFITPHSHRFDFDAQVLRGNVINRLWERVKDLEIGDFYQQSFLHYSGAIGEYEAEIGKIFKFSTFEMRYSAGSYYSMRAEHIHDITFSAGAVVLIEEGPAILDCSVILEPVCNGGEVAPTFRVEPWMFKKEPK